MKILGTIATIGIAAVLAGCAQQEEITMVTPEPTFDKFGEGSCVEGYIYVPGTAAQPPECIPPDECDELDSTMSAALPCPPPPPGRDDSSDDDDRDDGGRDPGGSTAPGRG